MRHLRTAVAALAAGALLAFTGCSSEPEGETPISQEARDLYQDSRLDKVEERLEAAEAALRRLASEPPATTASAPANEPRASAPARAPAPPTPEPLAVELLELAARPGEVNRTWTSYGYRARVRNNLDRSIEVWLEIRFQDADGFTLEEKRERVRLPALQEREVEGRTLVDASIAPRVARVTGELRLP